MSDKRFSTAVTLKRLSDEGSVEAVFSTSTIVDSDGDRVLSSAFRDGQHVGLTWSHDWQKIVGRGVVRVGPSQAVFAGKFFLNTTDGRDAHATVKEMSAPPSLQEWSFGFRVLDSEPGASGERVIKRVELFEVSPCLIGANRATHTLAVKRVTGAHRPDPALAALRRRFFAGLAARDRAERATVVALKARFDERTARDRRIGAEVLASAMQISARVGGYR